jgi:hypothetical protein
MAIIGMTALEYVAFRDAMDEKPKGCEYSVERAGGVGMPYVVSASGDGWKFVTFATWPADAVRELNAILAPKVAA